MKPALADILIAGIFWLLPSLAKTLRYVLVQMIYLIAHVSAQTAVINYMKLHFGGKHDNPTS